MLGRLQLLDCSGWACGVWRFVARRSLRRMQCVQRRSRVLSQTLILHSDVVLRYGLHLRQGWEERRGKKLKLISANVRGLLKVVGVADCQILAFVKSRGEDGRGRRAGCCG